MEFYSERRLQNWVDKINELKVSEEDPTTLLVFDQMLEDVIIACFNIINAVKRREIKKTEALNEIKKIKNIFNKNFEFNSELKEDLFFLTKESVKAVLASFEYFLEGKFSKKDLKELIKDAIESEKKGNLDLAFDMIARAGAKIIKGESLPELNIPDDSEIIGWIDGIDAISTTLELSRIDVSQNSEE
jgi:hypothetical protein